MSKRLDIVATRLDVEPEAVRAAAALLSASERQRASRCAFENDRRRFIVARATLRRLLASRLDVRPQDIEFAYGPHGKPALGPRFADSDLHFNVSHCDDLAVYAFAWRCEIGVDVEAVRWFPYADDVAAQFFSPGENEAYTALDSLSRPLGFFNCWTRKEAFIKALGDGLDYRLDSFDVSLAPNEPPKILRVENRVGEDCGWSVDSFFPAPGFVAAVVTENYGL
jgi:4'-phosphopantetheinyl transferase